MRAPLARPPSLSPRAPPPQDKWASVRDVVQQVAASSNVSTQPAIYGMVAAAEVQRLRGDGASTISGGDAVMLELAAAEMAAAAAELVAREKEMEVLRGQGVDSGVISLKDAAR